MAVKPVSSYTFATDGVYSTGPFIGSNTKVIPPGTEGFIPGTGIVAEWNNYLFNITGDWITNWLVLGSNAAGLDAHIVESDASGFTNIASGTFGGTAAASPGLVVTENSGATANSATIGNASGGLALIGSANGVYAAVRGLNTSTGAGLEGINVGGGGPGVLATGNGASPGLLATGGATGHGVRATAGATGGDGVNATTNTATRAGVRGVGSAVAINTYGVRGESAQANGQGVFGINQFAGADTTLLTNAAVASSSLDGAGTWAQSDNGYGLWAQSDTSSPTRAAVHIEGQDVSPTTALDGDLIFNSTKTQLELRASAVWKVLHQSPLGFQQAVSVPNAGTHNSLVYTAYGTVGFGSQIENVGRVKVSVTGSFRNAGGALNTVELQLYDVTGSVQIALTEISLDVTNAVITNPPAGVRPDNYERTLTLEGVYTIPDTTTRNYAVRIRTHNSGGTGVEWINLVVSVTGMY